MTRWNSVKPKKDASKANLGMEFENLLTQVCYQYAAQGRAYIHKRPTPMKIVRVFNRRLQQFVATWDSKSTVDYDGVWEGRFIAFEAKSTKNKTSIPLKNIKSHQVEHLRQVRKHGAITFYIFQFEGVWDRYVVPARMIEEYIHDSLRGGRKSIPIQAIKDEGEPVTKAGMIAFDFLGAVVRLMKRNAL